MQQLHRQTIRSEALFHSFFEQAQAPLLIVDQRNRIVAANPVATEMLGVDLDADEEIDLLRGFWRVSAAAITRMVEGVRRRVPVDSVAARTAADQLVDVSAFLIDGAGPSLLGVIVTDRSTVDDAQRRLKNEEERYRSLFEWAPVALREEDFSGVGLWLDRLRADGVTDLAEYMDEHPDEVEQAVMSIRTTRVNAATVELLKAPSVMAVLRGFRPEELTPQVCDAFKAQFLTLWEGGTDYHSDFVGVDYLGELFECRLRWKVPRTDRGRDLSRVAVWLLDLTQLRSTERRLERLVADKDRFIAAVSHELRTPLSAVLGLAEELTANWESFDPVEARELVSVIASQSTDLGLLVEDLLVAANLDANRVTINPEIVDLCGVATAALKECAHSLPGAPPVAVRGPVTCALADPVRVRQIIRNLITNAFRYGGDVIAVEIGVDDRPFVLVTDNGAGVPIEDRDAIFVPYHRAGTKRVLGSLGLGLAISRELARRMDGELSYTYEDGTSIFRLDLPPA